MITKLAPVAALTNGYATLILDNPRELAKVNSYLASFFYGVKRHDDKSKRKQARRRKVTRRRRRKHGAA